MVADVYQILKDLHYPLPYSKDNERLNPADSLVHHAAIKTILLLANAINSGKQAEPGEPDAITKFCLFVLAVNEHLNLKSHQPSPATVEHLKALADTLQIDPEDYEAVMSFFYSEKPYTDFSRAVYNAFEQDNPLIRSKGVHVYFTNHTPGEIIYLKYIPRFDLFLSKTFIIRRTYHSNKEDVSVKDLNIVTKRNYTEWYYEMPSFDDLTSRLMNFHRLQRVEVSQTSINPRITLDPDKGMISISGASSPISTTAYFEPINEWLDLFDADGKDTLNVYLHFYYYNTYTTKFLVNLVWKCNSLLKKGKQVGFYWYYDMDDDEMREFGEYLQTQFHDQTKFYVLESF